MRRLKKEYELFELYLKIAEGSVYYKLELIVDFIKNVDLLIPVTLEKKGGSNKYSKKPLVRWRSIDKESLIKVVKKEYPCGIAIVLDNYDFIVLDIDNIELFEERVAKINDLLEDRNFLGVVKTISGGYHFYLLKSEWQRLIDFNKLNNKKLLDTYGFEIRTQGLLLTPCSFNEGPDKYELINSRHDDGTLTTIMNQLLNILLSNELSNECELEEVHKDLKGMIKKIKKNVKFDDLDFLNERKAKEYTTYTIYHCPFHLPDQRPSFAVYRNSDYEIAVDFHDYTKYNIITFFAKYENINIKDAILRLSKLIEKQDENQNNITIPDILDEPKTKKKKKKTIEDVDLNELKRVFIDIFNIEKVEFYYNEKREKYYRFHTKHTEFDIKSSDLLEIDSFLKCYFNYHVRIPRAWYYSEYKSDISLFFEEVMQEIVETASEIVDIKLEGIVDTIIFILKHAPVVYNTSALRSDFLNIARYGSNYVFRFESLMNTLIRLHSIKIKTNELAYILSVNNIAKRSDERVKCGEDRIRVWIVVSDELISHYMSIEKQRLQKDEEGYNESLFTLQ